MDIRKEYEVGCILNTLEQGFEEQKMLEGKTQGELCCCLKKLTENKYRIVPNVDGFFLQGESIKSVDVEVFGKDKTKMLRMTKYLILGMAVEKLLGGDMRVTFKDGDKLYSF